MSLSRAKSICTSKRTSLEDFIATLQPLVNGDHFSEARLIEASGDHFSRAGLTEAKTRLNQLWGEFEANYEVVEELLADSGHKGLELKTCLNGYNDLRAKVWEEQNKIWETFLPVDTVEFSLYLSSCWTRTVTLNSIKNT